MDGDVTHETAYPQRGHHGPRRAIGERGNALLKMTFRALRNVSLNPLRGMAQWVGQGRRTVRTRPRHRATRSRPSLP